MCGPYNNTFSSIEICSNGLFNPQIRTSFRVKKNSLGHNALDLHSVMNKVALHMKPYVALPSIYGYGKETVKSICGTERGVNCRFFNPFTLSKAGAGLVRRGLLGVKVKVKEKTEIREERTKD